MSRDPHPERAIESWVATATRGLPASVAASVRGELLSHLEDAIEAHLQKGLSQAEAMQNALADLGAADTTANGLSDVHRGYLHYQLALFACLVSLIALLGLPTLHAQLGLVETTPARNLLISAGDVLMTSLVIYALVVLQRLLAWRFKLAHLAPFFLFTIVGLVGEIGEILISRHLLGYSIWGEATRTIFTVSSPLDFSLLLVGFISRVAVGVGLVPMAVSLWRSSDNIYGFAKPLAVTCIGVGVFLPGTTVLAQFSAWTVIEITYTLTTVSNMLAWPILSLIFYRAAFRDPIHFPTSWA